MKKLVFALLFAMASLLTANAQVKLEIPAETVDLKTKEDFVKYESVVVNAAKWLELTPLNKQKAQRKELGIFTFKWVVNNPTLDVQLNERLSQIYGKNDELLIIYLANYARNIIENKEAATKFTATKAALTSIMNVYQKGVRITKTTEMDELIKLTKDNKLDEFVTNHFL